MSTEFKSLSDLYKRILPALSFKKRELKRQGINLTEKDIFSILTKKWSKANNLSLYDIVEDILSFNEQ